MLTSVFAGIMMCCAVPVGGDKTADECFYFVFEAIGKGIRQDGMPRELAKKVAGNETDFVPKCTLCSATRKALYEYANESGKPTGQGISVSMVRRLDSADNKERRDAIKELIGKYVDDAFATKKISPADKAALQLAIAKERDTAMADKPAHLEFCPSCEGGSCQLPPDDNVGWGQPVDGVVSRLTLVTRNPQVGQKLRVRLEVKNSGTNPAKFDDQQAKVNNSLSIKGPQGQAITYIATSFQTMGQVEQLTPNETKTIFADLDVADSYLLDKPGDYTIQFVGRGGIPKSNELKVKLKDGKLNDIQTMVAALQKAAPQGWRVTVYDNAITILNTPTHLKADATSVSIEFTKSKGQMRQIGFGQPAPKYLLETKLGHAWLHPADDQVAKRWGDYEKVIEEQMKPFRKFEW